MHSLKFHRSRAKMTQDQLASKSGISQAYINELENGKKGNPSFIVIKKLSKALNINATDLFSNVEENI